MQELTIAVFENQDFTGHTHAASVSAPESEPERILEHLDDHDSSLVQLRPAGREMVFPLSSVERLVPRSALRDILPEDEPVDLASGLRVGMVHQAAVDAIPGGTGPLEFLIDLSIDVEVGLPRGCLAGGDATATVHFYVDPFLDDDGLPQGDLVGAEATNISGSGWCRDSRVKDELESELRDPELQNSVQDEVDGLFELVAGDDEPLFGFSDLYLLPGDGEYAGIERIENPREDAALVLVTNPIPVIDFPIGGHIDL